MRRLAATAVAISFAIAMMLLAARREGTRSPLAHLTEQMRSRPLEARLSGGFAYKPFASFARGVETPSLRDARRPFDVRFRAAAKSRIDAGVAYLLLGSSDEAIAILEAEILRTTGADDVSSALRLSGDANLLNDLAAAYLSRQSEVDPTDAVFAVEAVEYAWRLRQSPEIAWNRALTREAVRIRSAALASWNDVLAIESDPQWRAEAIRHLNLLGLRAQSRRWSAWRSANAFADLTSAAGQFPQELREYGEDHLLAQWAESGDASALRTAKTIGTALECAGGDALLSDSVRAIEHDYSLRKGHISYAVARRAFARQEYSNAIPQFRLAQRLLSLGKSPFALRAALYRATAEYYAANAAAATRHVDAITRSANYDESRYPALHGHVQWVIGLIAVSRGRNNDALVAFGAALEAFSRSHELENRAGIESLLAETYRDLGQVTRSWQFQRRALERLYALGRTRRSHAILTDAAMGAAALDAPLAATLFQNSLVSIARSSSDPISVCDAIIGRSIYASASGDRVSAEMDLAEAATLIQKISDLGMRKRSMANLLTAQAAVHRRFDPRRAAREAESAIAQMEQLGHRIRFVQLDLEAGKAFDAIHDTSGALHFWRAGISECDRQREELDDNEFRRTYLETCRSLFEESIRVLTREKRFADALRFAEHSRARGLLEARKHDLVRKRQEDDGAERTATPQNLTIVEYAVLPDRVVLWAIRGNRMTAVACPLSRTKLRKLISDQVAARENAAKFAKASSTLYEILIRPIRSELLKRVVFIPEDSLYRVSFAALVDRVSNRYLIEDHEISVAPSLAVLQQYQHTERAGTETVLVNAGSVANRFANEAVHLSGADHEIAKLRSLYPGAVVLDSVNCTRNRVLSLLERGRLVHFAGHAVGASKIEDPALVVQPGAYDRGLIYPMEISRLQLSAEVVVLGACATANGRIGSEGPLSVARAFLAGGASRVVATLWGIGDSSSSILLVDFHQGLLSGATAESALRTVQLRAIRASASASEWAAFEVLSARF